MRNFRKTATAVALGSLLGFAGAASANTIDLFTEPAGGVQRVAVGGAAPTVPAENQYFNNGGSIIGSYRDLALRNVTGTSAVNGATLAVADGKLTFNNDSNVRSTAVVQWDGGADAANPGTLVYGLGANLINQTGCPAGGCDHFSTTVFGADQGFTVELGVFTDANNWSTLSFESAAVSAPELTTFDFAWFDLDAGDHTLAPGFTVTIAHGAGYADFTSVGALQLLLSNVGANAAIDLEIGAVTKDGNDVPEPSALALAGIALLGAAAAGRRRKSA